MKTTNVIGTTPAEAEVLAATAAALAAGKDPYGDDDDDDNSAATALSADADADDDTDTDDTDTDDDDADPPAAADDDAPAAGDGDALTPEQLAAVAADEAQDEPAPTVDRFKAQSPAEFAAARKELLDKRAKAFKDYSDGVIEPEAYSLIDSEVFDALEALTVQRTLHEANAQRDASTQESVLDAIMTAAKAEGVDYVGDLKAAKRFDLEMQLLAEDGVKRTYAQAAALAHKNVLAVRGIAAKPAADPKPEPAKPRANGKPPMTLRNTPTAAMPNSGGNWQDALNKLSGQDYEAAYARLTQAQRDTMMND